MKHLFLFVSAFFLYGLNICSQSILEKPYNMFRSGNNLIKQQIEFKAPGEPGTNQFRDFSNQNTIYKHGEPSGISGTAFYYTPEEQYYGLRNDPDNLEKQERMKQDKEKRNNNDKQKTFSLERYPHGEYLLRIVVNDKVMGEKITKR